MSSNAETILYTGSRSCPTIESVENAIGILRHSAIEVAHLKPQRVAEDGFINQFNQAMLYLVWHQMFAIATRAIRSPYIPLSHVSSRSSISVLKDKDSGTGHKYRLVYLPPELIRHMSHGEAIVARVGDALYPHEPRDSPAQLFFLCPKREKLEITPDSIEEKCDAFFPFPANTPRRVMRFLLRSAGISAEMIEVFMGHWEERREPWGRFSSFDYRHYLNRLKSTVPEVLARLGFESPDRARRKYGN